MELVTILFKFLPKSSVLRESSKLGVRHLKERWIDVTMTIVVNATGNHVPPLLVFPRVHFKGHTMTGASFYWRCKTNRLFK
jgi:hypothetical protein